MVTTFFVYWAQNGWIVRARPALPQAIPFFHPAARGGCVRLLDQHWDVPQPDRWEAGVKCKLLEVFGPELDLPDLPKQWRTKNPVPLY